MGILHGQFVHKNINESDTFKNEKAVGSICHYAIGGALALTYPAIFLGFGIAMPGNNLIPGLIWGFVTALLPWLVLFPGFGWHREGESWKCSPCKCSVEMAEVKCEPCLST